MSTEYMTLNKFKGEELAGHIFLLLDNNRNVLLKELDTSLNNAREHTENESPLHLLLVGTLTKEVVRSEIQYVLNGEDEYTSFFPSSKLLTKEELKDKGLLRDILLSVASLIKDSWDLNCSYKTVNDITFIELPYSFFKNDVWNVIMKDQFVAVENNEIQYIRWSDTLQTFINPLELGRQIAKEKMVEVINQVPSINKRLLQEGLKLNEQLNNCSNKKESKELRKKKDLISKWLKRLTSSDKPYRHCNLKINPNYYFKPVSLFDNLELDSDKLITLGYLQALKWKELYNLAGDNIEMEIMKLNEDYFISFPLLPYEIVEILQLQTIPIENNVKEITQDSKGIWL